MLYPAELFSFHEAVIKLHTGVAAIAEWFIVRGAASAECHSIARLVPFAVRRFNRDASLNPQRPTATKGWIFYDADRRIKRLLYFPPCFLVMDDQPSCRAISLTVLLFKRPSLNFMLAWPPLQNGLLSEAPHRQSVTRLRVS